MRPSFLDTTLQPSIDIPQHPSYPSGHSTQINLIALFAKEKYPMFSAIYEKKANEYAINREYAGVHYKTDTQYGKIIAQYIFSKVSNPLL